MVRDIEDPQLRALCTRLANPYWMANPSRWIWQRKDGSPQGFGFSSIEPGMANLLWLSMECGTPPAEYEGADNALYTAVLLHGHGAMIDGEPLFSRAAVSTLQQFYDDLPSVLTADAKGLQRLYPILKVLAAARLNHG